jgi:ABC-type polysaccharide/polyol phosphate export permease
MVLAFALGIMSAIARDLRMVLPYFSQYFLLASPIFYESRPANSNIEIIIRNLNPFYYLLDLYRDLQYGLGSGLVSLVAPSILSIVVIAYLNKNGSRIVLQLKYALGKELNQEEEIGY